MSLRRGAKELSSSWTGDIAPASSSSSSSSSPNHSSGTSRARTWRAGFLCLLVTGVYLSQSPTAVNNNKNNDTDGVTTTSRSGNGKESSHHLRSSSSSSSAVKQHLTTSTVIADFRPIHETCTTARASSLMNNSVES